MSSKNITLPTEIADNWIGALRSGEYKQGTGRLICEIPELGTAEVTKDKASFCCLGVAGAICGVPLKDMYDKPLFGNVSSTKGVTDELVKNDKVIIFLSQLNDNNYSNDLGNHLDDGWVIREEILTVMKEDRRVLTFSEIADIIEDNVNKI